MRLQAVWSAVLLCSALVAVACREDSGEPSTEPVPASLSTVQQEVNSTNKVLILGSSVNGGLQSREA